VQAGEWPHDMRQPLDVVLYVKDVLLWSPESPNLYNVQLALVESGAELARITRRVGFRQLSAAGTQLLLNGKPFMVRGVLSWGWVPERVAPTYTREQALIELHQVRAMGFNLIKLCLVVPSPEYFEVADEEGLLLWEELPLWLPEVTAEMRAQAPLEYAGMADRLAKHPSLVLYSLGCELNQAVDGALINQLNTAVRSRVNDVLICDNSGSGESYGGLDFDFSDFTDYHPYYDLHYFEPLLDHWRRDWQTPRPWIFGEFCDSDTFRNLNEIIQANNGTRPWWLTRENPVTTWRSESKAMLEWETRLSVSQPGVALEEIVQTSLNQSYTIRKYTLEALRRRRGMGGYIVTGLRDTPISTSGIWDDFGRPKWTPDAFLHVNGEAVLALDVVRRRQWCFGGDRPDRVDPHNFWSGEHASWFVVLNDSGAGFPAGSALSWSLDDVAGQVLASGTSELKQDIHPGTPAQAGSIQVSLPQVDHPAELRLEACLSSGKREALNSWPVWVYPQPRTLADGLATYDPVSVLADFGDWLSQLPQIKKNPLSSGGPPALVATTLDNSVWEYLQTGGRVLLLQLGETPLPVRRCSFWREAVNLFANHPLWEQFPQRGFTDLQFFGLATDLTFDSPHLAEALPRGSVIRPILRRLDAREFHISEYLFEAAVGQGLLIGCTLRLQGGAGAQPFGWNRNVAGGALLHLLLQILTQPV
jgi:glycosyl hydrolase family 2